MALGIFHVTLARLTEKGFQQFRRVYTTNQVELQSSFQRVFRICLGVAAGALMTCGSIVLVLDRSVRATGLELKPPKYPWEMDRGLITSLNHSSIRRGWQVYKSVCASCHSLRFLYFKDLVNVSHTEDEVKAIAAEYEVQDGPNDEGQYFMRPAKLYDRVPSPFPNDEAARAANNGSLPLDLSFIVNARRRGKDYIFSLLTGYMEPPAGVEIGNGQFFNVYFPGGAIGMGEMIQDGVVDYDDGTPATQSQIAKDVVEFLTWTANQEWDERKRMLMKGIGIFLILIAAIANLNRQNWTSVRSRVIVHVPRRK